MSVEIVSVRCSQLAFSKHAYREDIGGNSFCFQLAFSEHVEIGLFAVSETRCSDTCVLDLDGAAVIHPRTPPSSLPPWDEFSGP